MTHKLNFTRAGLAAAALGCMASMAAAQVHVPPTPQLVADMVSPALPMANEFWCTVSNISSKPVTLNLLQITEDGVNQANVNASCTGTLAAGERCTFRTAVHPYRGQVVPYCRARFTGSQEGALVGSLRSSYTYNGTYYDLAVIPLQLIKGVPLATVNSPSN